MGHATLRKGRWAVTTYRVTRCYGGPEEGGWWYNWWQVQNVRTFGTQVAAESACERERKYLADMNGNATSDDARYNRWCLQMAERLGIDNPDDFGSQDFHKDFVIVVESSDNFRSMESTERPHYC
jgi:hypothetical protein